jgi:hypothetical protein
MDCGGSDRSGTINLTLADVDNTPGFHFEH